MSNLLDQITNISEDAARILKSEKMETDSEIMSLDRQDLRELLPEIKFTVRRDIYKIICEQQKQNHKCSVEAKFEELMELLTSECGEAGVLFNNEQLCEYVQMLKTFTDKLNDLLEKNKTNPFEECALSEEPSGSVSKPTANLASHSASDAPASEERADESQPSMLTRWMSRFTGQSQDKQVSFSSTINNNRPCNSPRLNLVVVSVTYKLVISGNTLDAHLKVLNFLHGPVPGSPVTLVLKETHCDEDSHVTIVFCPIVSRMGTDVEAALQKCSSDRPVIVVAMHHLHTPTAHPDPKTSRSGDLGVNVFFHETMGLLNCAQNHDAINKMKEKLLELSPKKRSINPQ